MFLQSQILVLRTQTVPVPEKGTRLTHKCKKFDYLNVIINWIWKYASVTNLYFIYSGRITTLLLVFQFWTHHRQTRDTQSHCTIDSLVAINIVLLLSGQAQIEKANKNWFSPTSCHLTRVWNGCSGSIHASQPVASTQVSIYLQTSTGSSEKNQGSGLFNDRINLGGRLKELISWQ